MRLALVALVMSVTPVLAGAVEAPSMESGHYADLCRDRNTKRGVLNDEAYRFCFGQQTDGNKKLAAILAENARYPWLQAVLDHAIEQTTKRGARNDDVLAYAVEQEIEAYKDLEYEQGKPGFVPRVADTCKERWTEHGAPAWHMIVSCYKHAVGAD